MGILSNLVRGFQVVSKKDLDAAQRDPLWGFMGGNLQSKTGLRIDADTALDSSAVWSAVMQLSQAVASLPLHLYKRLQPRGKKRFTEHPCYRILKLQPNPEMTSMVFREAMMGQVLLEGFCVAEIQRDASDNIQALWPLMSRRMELMRADNGELYYRYQMPNGDYHYFDRNQIFKVTGFSPNGLIGYRPIEKMTEPIGLSLALEEYAARFFGNGATPPAVLEHSESLSVEAQDRLRENWGKVYGGLSNTHRIAILEEGMKLKVFGITPEAAQAIESRRFMIEEVARIFNIPVHFLKELSNATYSNITHQDLEFVKYTLRPWLVRFEQEYNTRLLKPVQQNKLFFEHLIDGLLRGDAASRHDAYTKGRNWGYYSANDVREMENLNPVEGGDLYMVPLNMIPADQVANPLEPEVIIKEVEPEVEEETKEDEAKAYWKQETRTSVAGIKRIKHSYIPLFEDAAQRIVNKEVAAIKKAVKNHLRSAKTFEKWLDDFYKTMPEYIRKNFFPSQFTFVDQITKEASSMIGKDPLKDMTVEMSKWADDYMEGYTKRHVGTSVGQMKKILSTEDLEKVADAINKRADEWAEKRPMKIAKNETTRLANYIALETWKDGGITKKVWRTTGKNCPYCNKMDGKIVGIEKNFLEAGDVIHAEYDIKNKDGTTRKKWGTLSIKTNMAAPPAHGSCDCGISPE